MDGLISAELGRELLSREAWKGPLAALCFPSETLFCLKVMGGGSERDGGRERGIGHRNPHLGKVTVEVLLLENFPELSF